jgi:hypothetical protein
MPLCHCDLLADLFEETPAMKGEVVYLYAFDVADEIVTTGLVELLHKRCFPYAPRSDQALPRELPLYKPLAIEPEPLSEGPGGGPIHVLVRIYEVGVVTVAMRVGFDARTVEELMPFHRLTLNNGKTLDKLAQELCSAACAELGERTIRSALPSAPEAYTAFCLTDLDEAQDAGAWLEEQRRAVAGLLSEWDPTRLSEAQVNEVLRIRPSFERTDLVVIDWDAALVVDLTGYTDDVLFVLELANLQLEEFRIMDQRLDAYMNRAYVDLERRRGFLFQTSTRLLQTFRRFRMDATKLSDEVTHISKFIGDWYLARVYLGASERFHLDAWRGSIDRRLQQLDQLYSVVQSEVSERRMLWLEIAVLVLFLVDVLGVFLFKR